MSSTQEKIKEETPPSEAQVVPPPTPTLATSNETCNKTNSADGEVKEGQITFKKEIITTTPSNNEGIDDNKNVESSAPNNCHKNEDENPLVLKSQYVLSSYHPVMTPLVDPRDNNNSNTTTSNHNNNNTNNTDHHPNQKQKENRHKKNKRELKKRSRENDLSIQKVCKTFLQGKECPYGEDCKFSHDLKELLALRKEDIKEIGSCPHFDLKG